MYDYDRSIVAKAKAEWTEKGNQWLARAQYASGDKHTWSIKESGGGFVARVTTPEGTFKRKKPFDSLEAAQRYGARFIERADGADKLSAALEKDFAEE